MSVILVPWIVDPCPIAAGGYFVLDCCKQGESGRQSKGSVDVCTLSDTVAGAMARSTAAHRKAAKEEKIRQS